MARTAATFRQADLIRALKGARAAGLEIARVKIARDGSIEIDTSKLHNDESGEGEVVINPWDTI